jgi:type I restriction enzyme S subunit
MAKPEIRLKGFEGEWQDNVLGNVCSVNRGVRVTRKELDITGSYPVYQNTDYPMGFYNRYNVKRNNPFVIIGGSAGLIGFSENDFWAADDCAYFSDNEEINKTFLYYTLLKHNSIIKNNVRGSSVPRLDRKVLVNLKISLPPISEQQAIADYFKSLDKMIQGVTKKIESLKQMKSASLISMFPQAGETTPRVRFKGFEGEWERKQLSDCLDISKNRNTDGRYGKDDVLSVSDDFGVMNQIELLGRSYAGKSVNNYGILEHGQLVYTKSPLKSKPYGIVKENTGETGIVSVLYAIYTAKENTWIPYIHYYFDPAWRLNAYLRPLINKGAKNTMNISDETALTGYIMIPKDIKEQQRIASFFKSLDKQISFQEQRLEKLKQIKAACLDKMFV